MYRPRHAQDAEKQHSAHLYKNADLRQARPRSITVYNKVTVPAAHNPLNRSP